MTMAFANDGSERADTPILEVHELTIGLPSGSDRSSAVQKVSFSVGRGEIVCLVGESGSGKSVIAQSVMGLLPKSLPVRGGRILLQGEDITHAPQARLRELRATRMSMIFQEPMTALNPVMTCGDQIDEVLAEHTSLSASERRAKVRSIITEVLLPGALPNIVTGIRTGLGFAWRGLIAAEMIATNVGLGYMLFVARDFYRTEVIVLGMIVIGLLWLLIDRLLLAPLERRTIERWGLVRAA
jgi:ABC-type uncharacterized transport system YnjBCD ATPase subunit